MRKPDALLLWTIGHSTRSIAEFVEILDAHRIEALADVRRYPMSRRHPQFNREPLQESLAAASIDYHWLEALGGRRYPRADSPNVGWRVTGFRGYADYMETQPFLDGRSRLLEVAAAKRTAYMCAELLWWQCHRRLISDSLLAMGHEVLHIQTAAPATPHRITPPATLRDGHLSYAPQQTELGW